MPKNLLPNDLVGTPFNCHDVRNVKRLFPFQFLIKSVMILHIHHILFFLKNSHFGLFTLSVCIDSIPYLIRSLSHFYILAANIFLMCNGQNLGTLFSSIIISVSVPFLFQLFFFTEHIFSSY